MQAKDIDTLRLLRIVDWLSRVWSIHWPPPRPEAHWVTLWDVERLVPDFKPKVVKAKLRQMGKAKLITGCFCGCRADLELLEKGKEMLNAATD